MRFGLKNVISALHRGPGISRVASEKLYQACQANRALVEDHLATEGMRLLHDDHLGLFSAFCKDREQIEEECLSEGVEPFLPAWNAQALDYHTSVVAIILRRRRIGTEGAQDDWTAAADALSEFETYLPESDRNQEVRSQKRFWRCVETLERLQLAETGLSPQKDVTIRATGWLLLRLTVAEVERFTGEVLAWAGEDGEDDDEDILQGLGAAVADALRETADE